MVEYIYLVGSLITFAIWTLLYFIRRDLRKEMLVMGSIFGVLGIIMEAFIYTKDWWKPATITGTLIGVEDFLFGFGVGGIAAIVYEDLFKRIISRKKTDHPHTKQLIIIIIVSIIIFNLMFYILRYNSFLSGLTATLVGTMVIWTIRKDLIIDSIVAGTTLTLFSFVGFAILNILDSRFVYEWWFLDKLSGIIILGVPLEDIIWFFTTGLFIGPIYELWQGGRFKKLK